MRVGLSTAFLSSTATDFRVTVIERRVFEDQAKVIED